MLELNSEGMMRVMPARAAASIRGSWEDMADVGRQDRRMSWPFRAVARVGMEE